MPDTSVDVVADVVSGGPIDYWDWDWPGALNGTYDEYDYDSTATVWSNSSGQYTVWAEGTDYYEQYDSDYAWVYVIDVYIDTPSSFPAYVELGNDMALCCTPYGATGGSYSWTKVSGPGNVTFSPSASAEDPDFSADESGNYTVKVEYTKEEATASDTSGTIKVVKVTEVISSKDVACIGENVTFGAITDPLNCGHLVTVTWSGGGTPPTGSGSQFTTNWSTPGTKTVTATCGTSSAQKDVTVVGVDKVVESGTTDEGPLYIVCPDDTVDLEAKPNPAGASFPAGEPHWEIVSQPGTGASLNPSSGSATTTLSGLTEPGDYSVKAKCGAVDTGDTITVIVVKVDINAGLSEQDELDPGKYINVNWDDDDNDGWQPDDTPPGGTYTGDKSDPNIDGGDNDFRSFTVSISPQQTIVENFPNSKVSITFPSKVKVWQTNTKKTVLGESSELTSGAQFKVENLPKQFYLEGVSGSSTFKDVELEATWLPKSFSDVVKVTVFEVDLTGLFSFGPMQNDNSATPFSQTYDSSDNDGKISWDDANGDGTKGDNDPNCEYFKNCMELQGTVNPSGVTSEVDFEFKQEKWRKTWYKKGTGSWNLDSDATPWQSDNSPGQCQDTNPSAANRIYDTDAPGLLFRDCISLYDHYAYIGDFKQWVNVKIDGCWYQCSNYYKWHSQIYTEPKTGTNYMTRDALGLQKLSSGWITVPSLP